MPEFRFMMVMPSFCLAQTAMEQPRPPVSTFLIPQTINFIAFFTSIFFLRPIYLRPIDIPSVTSVTPSVAELPSLI